MGHASVQPSELPPPTIDTAPPTTTAKAHAPHQTTEAPPWDPHMCLSGRRCGCCDAGAGAGGGGGTGVPDPPAAGEVGHVHCPDPRCHHHSRHPFETVVDLRKHLDHAHSAPQWNFHSFWTALQRQFPKAKPCPHCRPPFANVRNHQPKCQGADGHPRGARARAAAGAGPHLSAADDTAIGAWRPEHADMERAYELFGGFEGFHTKRYQQVNTDRRSSVARNHCRWVMEQLVNAATRAAGDVDPNDPATLLQSKGAWSLVYIFVRQTQAPRFPNQTHISANELPGRVLKFCNGGYDIALTSVGRDTAGAL